MTTTPAMPTDPEVIERIQAALGSDESPAPWIARAFEALAMAQAATARADELAAERVSLVDALRAKNRLLDRAQEALIWCGGSPSFAPEGEACEGWKRMVVPLLLDLAPTPAAPEQAPDREPGSNGEHFELEALKRRVREFEAASGISIEQNAVKPLGAAVKAVMAMDPGSWRSVIQQLQRAAEAGREITAAAEAALGDQVADLVEAFRG